MIFLRLHQFLWCYAGSAQHSQQRKRQNLLVATTTRGSHGGASCATLFSVLGAQYYRSVVFCGGPHMFVDVQWAKPGSVLAPIVVLTTASMTQTPAGWVAVVFDTWLSKNFSFFLLLHSFRFFTFFGRAVPNAVTHPLGVSFKELAGCEQVPCV